MDARELLQIVNGERCPCGHLVADKHHPPGEIPGEKWGPCQHEDCECKGVIDISDEEVTEV